MNNKLLITLAALGAMLAGYWLGQQQDTPAAGNATALPSIQGFILQTPRKIGIPELLKDDGQAFGKQDLAGRWSLMFYGYTNCPDICPATMSVLSAAKKLAEDQQRPFPQVVFVSVDPQRDNARLVADYVRYFDEDFIGITGEEKLLQAMAMQMSVAAMSVPAEKPGDAYLVDHSANLMLLNPAVEMVAMLKPPFTAEHILQTIKTVQSVRD